MNLWGWRRLAAFEAEGAASGGAGGQAQQGAAGGTAATSSSSSAATGLFDAVEQDAPRQDADGRPVKPEWLPDNFWNGDKGEILTDQLAKSWRDLRTKVAQGGADRPPEKAEAYQLPKVEGLPEGFIGGEKDTLWPTIRQAAHKAGVSQRQLEALAGPFLQAVAEQMKAGGTGTGDDQAAAQAFEAELQQLGPNGRRLVQDVGGWMKGLVSRGIFADDEVQALRGVTTAAGVRALAKLRELTGEQPIPVDALASEGGTVADLRRMMTEGYAKGDQALIEKARRGLTEAERRGELQ